MIATSGRYPRRFAVLFVGVALALSALSSGCTKPDDPAYYVEQLGSEKDETRRRAVEELKRMQEKALPAIEAGLESENPRIRQGSLQALANMRRMSSLGTAGELIDDPNKDVRLQAITTISTLAGVWKERSTELLGQALRQEDTDVIKKAALGLKDMAYDEATAVLQETYEQGEGLSATYAARYLYEVEPSEEIARFLLERMVSGSEAEAQAAEASLKELKDRIVPALVEFVDERSNQRVRNLLTEIRDGLITELTQILDSKRAQKILAALGVIADQPSVEKLIKDMRDTRLQSAWRVAAASALGTAAASPRSSQSLRREAIDALAEMVDREGGNSQVRIGAAISMCRLRQSKGVDYLLTQLDTFQEIMGGEREVSASELEGLKELRIRAQEALTASGNFVVEPLREKLTTPDEKPGPIIIWAAAKTFGELRVEDTVPLMRKYILSRREDSEEDPLIYVGEDGGLSEEVALSNWQEPDEEEVAELQEKLDPFAYPDYVRWTVANALRRIGGEQAISVLKEAAQEERDFVERLRKNADRRDYHQRQPVIEGLMAQHEDVLFYVRMALERLGTPMVAETGS
ncbi:MAG: hypothetical protein R6X33_05755 [Candidatus Brocadiia bacterium]